MSARRWLDAWRSAVTIARRVAGVPDYEAYVRHVRSRHPDRSIPTRTEFFAERQRARYRGADRGCC